MINRAARQARAYRADRRARRSAIDFHRGEEAGELHTCSSCHGTFDVNFMLRDHEAWTCEACDYAAEAEQTLAGAGSEHFGPAVVAALLVVGLVGVEQLSFEPGPGVFWLLWCAVVVTAAGLIATWTEGLRRAGIWHPGLLAIEAATVAIAAVYVVRGVLPLVFG